MVLHLSGKGLAVVEGPGFGLEAVFAMVAAAGDEQGHPDSNAIGDIAGLDVAVVHKIAPFLKINLGFGDFSGGKW